MMTLLTTWFAYPALLGLMGLLPALALVLVRARRRRRQACALLGSPAALQKLQQPTVSSGNWRSVCLFLGLALLMFGAAGPRWGRASNFSMRGPERALVLVLDVSRSM